MQSGRIAIGCDHAGYDMKEWLKGRLSGAGFKVTDFGAYSHEAVDYPDHIHPVAQAVGSGKADFGIILCGSGNGAAMTANKHKGIRAALCWLPELGTLAKQHNNANILALPARYISKETAMEIINAYMKSFFEGGRHERRVEKIDV
jgi:ribose 5-phosphate isomerase B